MLKREKTGMMKENDRKERQKKSKIDFFEYHVSLECQICFMERLKLKNHSTVESGYAYICSNHKK